MDEEHERLPQEDHDDWLAENIDFSDEEDLTKSKGYISNAPMYQQRNQTGGKRNKNWMPERKGGLGGKLYLGKMADGTNDFTQVDSFQTYLKTTTKHRGLGLPKSGGYK